MSSDSAFCSMRRALIELAVFFHQRGGEHVGDGAAEDGGDGGGEVARRVSRRADAVADVDGGREVGVFGEADAVAEEGVGEFSRGDMGRGVVAEDARRFRPSRFRRLGRSRCSSRWCRCLGRCALLRASARANRPRSSTARWRRWRRRPSWCGCRTGSAIFRFHHFRRVARRGGGCFGVLRCAFQGTGVRGQGSGKRRLRRLRFLEGVAGRRASHYAATGRRRRWRGSC